SKNQNVVVNDADAGPQVNATITNRNIFGHGEQALAEQQRLQHLATQERLQALAQQETGFGTPGDPHGSANGTTTDPNRARNHASAKLHSFLIRQVGPLAPPPPDDQTHLAVRGGNPWTAH